ncbi:class I SAM-dependent methyltransferase [bacterium SCSIO 12741]|nr:class I SAM-dependent methyltransferase [bacterium SCSIO 12741]
MGHHNKSDWFGEWFDSPYYSILYKDRSDSEAREFIQRLLDHLKPKADARILDLACGRGRHSKEMARLGYQVTGIDLSAHAIKQANLHGCQNLHFAIQDMREVYRENYFDCIFNLFTSFGYFNDSEDNLKVLQSVVQGLVPEGCFVLDFLNCHKLRKHLNPSEVKVVDGIKFNIERVLQNHTITKHIHFEDGGRSYDFEERVTAFTREELEELLSQAQLNIREVFGSYDLESFDLETSDRLILITQKKN